MALREAPQPGKEYLTLVSSHNYQVFFFFQAEYGIRDIGVTGVQTCALPISAGETQTAVPFEMLKAIADSYVTPPDGFTVHPKVMPQLQRRAAAITEGPIDWGTGEILAFGALLMDGRPVRLAGQDSRRGTFVQRFAAIVDRVTGES